MIDMPPVLDNASPEDLKELVQLLRVNALERENAREPRATQCIGAYGPSYPRGVAQAASARPGQ